MIRADIKSDPELLERLRAAVEAFKVLPPEAQKAMLDAQKKQWAESAPGDLRTTI